jgi:hypothetical protein
LQVDFIEAGGFGESHKIALVEIDHGVRHAAGCDRQQDFASTGVAKKSGHERETNRCGHRVRQLASLELKASSVYTEFENHQG